MESHANLDSFPEPILIKDSRVTCHFKFSVYLVMRIVHSADKEVARGTSAPWLARLDCYLTVGWEVEGLSPGRTNTQGLTIVEEKVLPLL